MRVNFFEDGSFNVVGHRNSDLFTREDQHLKRTLSGKKRNIIRRCVAYATLTYWVFIPDINKPVIRGK